MCLPLSGVLAPLLVSVTELANITSVQVAWNQPEGGLAVDEYIVSYYRLNGREGQCSSFQDEGSVTVRAETQVVSYVAILHLKAYSSYVVNVTGMKGALYNTSDSLQFETNSTGIIATNTQVSMYSIICVAIYCQLYIFSAPSGMPQNLAIISSTSTSVTISWNSVECIHRNGLIIHYIVSYSELENGIPTIKTVRSSEPDDGGSYTATGLEPSASYLFLVAAINSIGLGPFAAIQS